MPGIGEISARERGIKTSDPLAGEIAEATNARGTDCQRVCSAVNRCLLGHPAAAT
jgi:hypothetical protein